ncbi:hypothetical protein FDP41_005954 [Naegleria fowleri]|uniref:Uncharacterized protein n=1 Tax=Naegleria fowleri TaxID=5763 RepID=A0A6A5BLH5_NAEFO|nr:uncharacterized protein FDP41_005954 [Naegleria fowleri]KAF0975201.1 hypothetical protein FDP41_005954 [Naegleria fowleri]
MTCNRCTNWRNVEWYSYVDGQQGNLKLFVENQGFLKCTPNEVALAVTTKDPPNKFFPRGVGTLDYLAVNVRALNVFYLDYFGMLGSSKLSKSSLDSLKALGRIFAIEPRLPATQGISFSH